MREQEEKDEEGKAGRFARKGKQEGQGGKVVAGGGCWVRDGVKFEFLGRRRTLGLQFEPNFSR